MLIIINLIPSNGETDDKTFKKILILSFLYLHTEN